MTSFVVTNSGELIPSYGAASMDQEATRAKAKDSTGHAKFRKLASSRAKKAMRNMRLIATMGRSQVFEYTQADADKIVGALELELEAIKKALAEPEVQTDIEFDL